jgi:hypothetical protein
MSADDKRRVILKIYHDRKEPFNLKEIELIASKQVEEHTTVICRNERILTPRPLRRGLCSKLLKT